MIIGLGSDIVNIQRILELIKKHPRRAPERLLHPDEKLDFERISASNLIGKATFLAKRFAAKEACVKALGTGFRRGIRFQDIQISHDGLGKPMLLLHARAKEILLEKSSKSAQAKFDITISDDFPLAQSIVILSLTPCA